MKGDEAPFLTFVTNKTTCRYVWREREREREVLLAISTGDLHVGC